MVTWLETFFDFVTIPPGLTCSFRYTLDCKPSCKNSRVLAGSKRIRCALLIVWWVQRRLPIPSNIRHKSATNKKNSLVILMFFFFTWFFRNMKGSTAENRMIFEVPSKMFYYFTFSWHNFVIFCTVPPDTGGRHLKETIRWKKNLSTLSHNCALLIHLCSQTVFATFLKLDDRFFRTV